MANYRAKLCLKEIHQASLNVLKDLDRFCRENSIRYYVFFGTLIGAVRHKGFIPWDDDIDVIMLRSDYDKFLEEYSQRGKYRVVNYKTEPKCPFMISRVSDDSYSLYSKYGPNYKIGAFVDVYPFDFIGENLSQIARKARYTQKFSSRLTKSLERNVFGVIKDTHNGIKKWLLLLAYIIPKMMGCGYYRRKLLDLLDIDSKNKTDCKYVGCVLWDLTKESAFDIELLEETVDLEFENMMVMAPAKYDFILSQIYGDYMKIPPESEQISHHYYQIYENFSETDVI